MFPSFSANLEFSLKDVTSSFLIPLRVLLVSLIYIFIQQNFTFLIVFYELS